MLSERFEIFWLSANEGAVLGDGAGFSVEPGRVEYVKLAVLGLSAMKSSNPK